MVWIYSSSGHHGVHSASAFLRRFIMATPRVDGVSSFPAGAAMLSPVRAQKLLEWPEPIQRVQALAESGIQTLPLKYVRPPNERPTGALVGHHDQIPVIDLAGLGDRSRRPQTMQEISDACKQWGFFQLINHGISPRLLKSASEVSRQFFDLPMAEKEKYANDPRTYEGYGSRIGVQKDAVLDWGDYYFHHFLPLSQRNYHTRWPSKPPAYRRIMAEYCEEVSELFTDLLSILSANLGLRRGALEEEFGGRDKVGMCVRINYYPACPQPDLTFGVSPHSDPGGMTFLLQDGVEGLQVRKGPAWVPVRPLPGALVVNLGDQMEILTNGAYKSIEHRSVVNEKKERMSLVVFCNPDGEKALGPMKELTSDSSPPLYAQMTFNQYRMFIRTTGTKGKKYVNSIGSALK